MTVITIIYYYENNARLIFTEITILLELLGAMMDEIRNYYVIYDVDKDCNMTSFGGCNIPGFKIKGGYGYYEFKEPEYIKPHRNVMLVDKVGEFFFFFFFFLLLA